MSFVQKVEIIIVCRLSRGFKIPWMQGPPHPLRQPMAIMQKSFLQRKHHSCFLLPWHEKRAHMHLATRRHCLRSKCRLCQKYKEHFSTLPLFYFSACLFYFSTLSNTSVVPTSEEGMLRPINYKERTTLKVQRVMLGNWQNRLSSSLT